MAHRHLKFGVRVDFFRAALAALGMDAEQVLMVGDNAHDDGGGTRLGLRTLILPRTAGRIHGLAADRVELDEIVHTSLQRAGLWEEVKDRLMTDGSEAVGGAAAVIDKHMHSELARLRKVIKEAGIRRE